MGSREVLKVLGYSCKCFSNRVDRYADDLLAGGELYWWSPGMET